MLWQIAWKNLWRVPRRTVVVLTAVVVGVWAMLALGALNRGMMDQLMDSAVRNLTGHVQIQAAGYFNDPVVRHTIQDPEKVFALLKSLPARVRWAPRIKVPGAVSNARNSAGISIVGIDPEREKDVSFIGSAVTQGVYLSADTPYGILIGEKLAHKFETGLGKKLVVMAQDAEGKIASGGYRIAGIFSAEMRDTEEQVAFVHLDSLKKLLKVGNGISMVTLLAPSHDMTDSLVRDLKPKLPKGTALFTWRELQPLTNAMLDLWNSMMYLWYLVVFVAIGFGLVNTMLMAVLDRIREFGMLKAIGMKPGRIALLILLESLALIILGAVVGNAVTFAFVAWLGKVGINLSALAEGMNAIGIPHIIYPALSMKDFLPANGTVLILGLLVCLYPAIKGARISPVEAMRRT